MLDVVVCASGKLGLLGLNKILALKTVRIRAVLTDKNSIQIIALAQERKIMACVGNPRKKRFDRTLPSFDVLASVNYLFLLPREIYSRAGTLAFNIHGSLLPKYMGRTPNTWAIIHDESVTGITVHEITEECDSGDILYQERLKITNVDTGGTLLQKMSKRYPVILEKVFKDIQLRRVRKTPQDLSRKSYCGKREPQDGKIDWNNSARRVYNWVRAQTKPYPGAFFYHRKRKYIVWQVEECYQPEVFKGKRVGVPFMKNRGMYVRCGVGAVKVVAYDTGGDNG